MIIECEKRPGQKPSFEEFMKEVRERAEEIYRQRTGKKKSGNEKSDWLQAELYIKIKYDLL